MKELVSVCLLTYNHEAFIEDALKGILDQTYRDIELIILDDASTDHTVDIIDEYEVKLKNRFEKFIFIKHTDNLGNIPKNCNELILNASGIYLKEIAGDDILLPHCVDTLVKKAHEHQDADVIYANGFIEKANFKYGNEYSWRLFRDAVSGYESSDLFAQLMYRNFVFAPSVLLRKEIFEQEGYYDEEIAYEDYEMWLRLSSSGKKFYYCNEPVLVYRRSDDALSYINSIEHEEKLITCIKAEIETKDKYMERLCERDRMAVMTFTFNRLYYMADGIGSEKCKKILMDYFNLRAPIQQETDDKLLINKLNTESEILCQWVDHPERVERFLKLIGRNKRIAIFGYSRLGHRVHNLLTKNGMEPAYIIDQKGNRLISRVKVYRIEEDLPETDLIIVTAMGVFDSLFNTLKEKTNANVVNLMYALYFEDLYID